MLIFVNLCLTFVSSSRPHSLQHLSHGINFGQQLGQDQPRPATGTDQSVQYSTDQPPVQVRQQSVSASMGDCLQISFNLIYSTALRTQLLNPPDVFALSKENRKIEFPSFVKCSYKKYDKMTHDTRK